MKKKVCIILTMFICLACILSACNGESQYQSKTSNLNTDILSKKNSYSDSKSFDQSDVLDYQAASLTAQEVDDDAVKENEGENASGNINNQTNESSNPQSEVKSEKKEEKLVYTCNISIETTDYKETLIAIEEIIEKNGGIIDSQNDSDTSSNWYYDDYEKTSGTLHTNMVIRVPSKNYQSFLKSLEGKGKIKNKSMNVENITKQYYDIETTIESLKIQEQRLLAMMKNAKDIKEMITVEDRLTQVQNELSQYQKQLSYMDMEVAYSTITISVDEVLEYKESEFGKKTNHFIDRLKNVLKESWKNFLSLLEGLLFFCIYMLPFAVVGLIVWIVITPLRKKMKIKNEQKRKEILEKRKKIEEARKEKVNNNQ